MTSVWVSDAFAGVLARRGPKTPREGRRPFRPLAYVPVGMYLDQFLLEILMGQLFSCATPSPKITYEKQTIIWYVFFLEKQPICQFKKIVISSIYWKFCILMPG